MDAVLTVDVAQIVDVVPTVDVAQIVDGANLRCGSKSMTHTHIVHDDVEMAGITKARAEMAVALTTMILQTHSSRTPGILPTENKSLLLTNKCRDGGADGLPLTVPLFLMTHVAVLAVAAGALDSNFALHSLCIAAKRPRRWTHGVSCTFLCRLQATMQSNYHGLLFYVARPTMNMQSIPVTR